MRSGSATRSSPSTPLSYGGFPSHTGGKSPGRAVAPALSTVRQDTQNAGRLLVDRVAALIDGQKIESARIPTELALRDSA